MKNILDGLSFKFVIIINVYNYILSFLKMTFHNIHTENDMALNNNKINSTYNNVGTRSKK